MACRTQRQKVMAAAHPSGSEVSILEIRRLSGCSFDDAVKIWNEGFQGYFVDMTLSLDRYLSRLQLEGLSPQFSLMAFCTENRQGFFFMDLGQTRSAKMHGMSA